MSDVGATAPALPTLHGAWLRALTGVPDPPSERRATCGDCVMCAGVERSGSRVTFVPDVKCCSYVPHLANFLTGRALAGPGRRTVLRRIGRRSGVTPLGLGLSRDDIRRMVGAQSHFGQVDVVRCPHFVEGTGGCSIWESRNAVCSTWFCQHERGAVGQRSWHAVRDLLIAVEEGVARHCLGLGDLPDEQVRAVLDHRAAIRDMVRRANSGEALTASASDDDESPQWYARMWGAWEGREEAWFARCAEAGAALDGEQLTSMIDDVRDLAADVVRCRADLERHDLPARLVFAPGAGTEATIDVLRLVGYSPFDPLVLPAELQPALWQLDGRPVVQVLAEIEQLSGVRLGDDLLGGLHDYGVAAEPRVQVALPGRVLSLGAAADGAADGAQQPAVGGGKRLELGGELVNP